MVSATLGLGGLSRTVPHYTLIQDFLYFIRLRATTIIEWRATTHGECIIVINIQLYPEFGEYLGYIFVNIAY